MNLMKTRQKFGAQRGFSLPELMIVVLILAILAVLALPQIIASRRAFSFAGMQRQVASKLSQARQEAMTQKKAITVKYDDASKSLILYGGKFGAEGAATNDRTALAVSGLEAANLVYGRPSGAPGSALSDTANLTPLTSGAAIITFHADGSVVDENDNPQNRAFFFYNNLDPSRMAFAVSVLGAGGRVKVWRYNDTIQTYVE